MLLLLLLLRVLPLVAVLLLLPLPQCITQPLHIGREAQRACPRVHVRNKGRKG